MTTTNLKQLIERSGLRPSFIARHCGVSLVSVWKWQQGTRPREEHLKSLAEILGISVSQLRKIVDADKRNKSKLSPKSNSY